MDLLSLPEYVTKKGRLHGHRYGKKTGDKKYHLANQLKKKCEKEKFQGIDDRFWRDHEFRVRMIEHNREKEVCRRWDALADEDRTHYLSEQEYFYYKNKWWLHSNKQGSNTIPWRNRSDFKQALSALERLQQEAGEEPYVPNCSNKHEQWQLPSSSSSTWWNWQDAGWSSYNSESQGGSDQSLGNERRDPLFLVPWRTTPKMAFKNSISFCYRWIVYNWRRSIFTDGVCKDNTSYDPFSRCATCNNYGYNLNWGCKDKVGLQHEENLDFVCVVTMTTWQPRPHCTCNTTPDQC